MNYNIVKQVYGKLPYIIKAPFAGAIRKRLIENPIFIEQYKNLEELDELGETQIEKKQFEFLKEALVHAYEHTVYYRNLFDKIKFNPNEIQNVNELQKIPVLTKEILKEHFEELAADDIDGSYMVTTGGTSGEPTTILMENKALYREWAFVYHFWSKYGYDYKKSKLATFRGVDLGNKICEINPLYQEIRMNPFILNNKNFNQYMKKIEDYGADFIYGYPSAIFHFCKLAKWEGISLKGKFRAALLISENLYSFQEEIIREVLDCPIGIFYGHSERAVFGEKTGKGYCFNPFYGVTEISVNDEPVVTGFINKKMPLIRYVVDDTVKEVDNSEYEVEGHRNSAVIFGKDGTEIRAGLLDFHGLLSEKLGELQMVQNEPGELIIRVVNDNTLKMEEIERIRKECEAKLGQRFRIKIEIVDVLESNSSTKKYKLLVQNLCGGGQTRINKMYTIIGHRDADVLYGKNGEEVSMGAVNFHDKTFKNIEAYQFVQDIQGECTLCVMSTVQLEQEEVQRIKKGIEQKLGAAFKCKVLIVDKMQLTSRGKYKMLIQNCK